MADDLKPLVIIGAGGYAQEVAWLVHDINQHRPEWNLLGFVDPVGSGKTEHYGLPVLGGYEDVAARFGEVYFACGMGTAQIRAKESVRAEACRWRAAALVHPSAFRAQFVAVGDGSIIGPGCVLGPNVRIGRHCLLNVYSSVGHDAVIGDFSVIAPGARILGNVTLEDMVFVGANATVYPKRRMGSGSTLAANSFLHASVPAGQSVLGVVAKPFLPVRIDSKENA